jgi:tetratricopeptide (TPR) repeat protein
VFQKLYQRQLLCVRLLTVISGTLLVDCATAQYVNTGEPDANQASIVVASDRSSAVQNGALSRSTSRPVVSAEDLPNQKAPLNDAAANASFRLAKSNGPINRSSLEVIAPQAQAHINYALNLAERGAVRSAQAEFTMALDLVADALDADTNSKSRAHARAVKAGLTAIAETKDFVPADTPHDLEINLAQVAATHKTPVLKNVDSTRMTRAQALQLYHAYATQQLAFAGGRSAMASSALYGLGRAEAITITSASTRNPLGSPNAMALFQAALMVDPQNYMASNELGVLMARYGDFDGAAGLLVRSLSVKPRVETWHNLAMVYRSMGQLAKAEQAEREREKMLVAARSRGAGTGNSTDLGSRPTLQWVDVDTFAASATPNGLDGTTASPNKPAYIAQRDSLGKRLISRVLPWPKGNQPQQSADSTQQDSKTDPSRGGEADSRTPFKQGM